MFRFTIRDVLSLTLVAAMALGWGVDHFQSDDRLIQQRAAAMEIFLTDRGWTIAQEGWNVKIGKGHLPYPELELFVVEPQSTESRDGRKP